MSDAAGREMPIPSRVERVFPAGPPAAIMLYTLAPDLLLGWPRANRPEECVYMLPEICARPEVGRITGRGNTANLEVVLALKPDLILDVGSTNPTFVSLATRVQEQTGIPYALLDGRFDATLDLSQARRIDHRSRRPRRWRAADETMTTIKEGIAAIPDEQAALASITRAGRAGSRPGSAARSMSRPSSFSGRAMSRPRRRGGLAQSSRLSRSWSWDPEVVVTIDRDFAANFRHQVGVG